MASGRFAEQYASLEKLRELTSTMKANQGLRGRAQLELRLAERAKKTTWRQMKGIQLFMHELTHPHNRPFVIGMGIMSSVFMYLYLLGRNSEQAKKDSKYWQRFHAHH